MRTADISTNFHQCCAAETLCSAAVSPQLTVYVLDNSCTRTACSCTGVQIVSSHILTDVTVAVTKQLGGRVPGPHGCCAYATVVVLHCVTGVTGQSGSTPLPPEKFSPRISANPMAWPDWGWVGHVPPPVTPLLGAEYFVG